MRTADEEGMSEKSPKGIYARTSCCLLIWELFLVFARMSRNLNRGWSDLSMARDAFCARPQWPDRRSHRCASSQVQRPMSGHHEYSQQGRLSAGHLLMLGSRQIENLPFADNAGHGASSFDFLPFQHSFGLGTILPLSQQCPVTAETAKSASSSGVRSGKPYIG